LNELKSNALLISFYGFTDRAIQQLIFVLIILSGSFLMLDHHIIRITPPFN